MDMVSMIHKDKIFNILEREELTSTQKLILVTIQSFNETCDSDISLSDIQFYTSLSRKGIINNIKALEEIGVLKVVRHSTVKNEYIVKV